MRWGPDYWCTPRAYWTMRYAIVLARSSMNMRLYYLDSAMIPSSAGCARPHMAARSIFPRLGIGSVWPVRPPVCGNRWGDRPVRGRGFDSAWLRRVVFVCGYARCRRTCRRDPRTSRFGQPTLSGTAPHLSPTAQSRSILVRAVRGIWWICLRGCWAMARATLNPFNTSSTPGGEFASAYGRTNHHRP